MKKRTNLNNWPVVSIALLAVLSGSVRATGTYEDGDGSPGNPFQIKTAAQMDEIGQHSEDWNKHFILTTNINLSGYTGTQFHVIGNTGINFTGEFDGDGHTISNFTYTSTGINIGLFGIVGSAGEVKNLGLVNATVTGYDRTGSLVGANNGTVSNCYAAGSVSGDNYVGGLVGANNGTVSNCCTTGTVTGTGRDVGGLVGINHATVSNCYATGSITGTYYSIGGLVGHNWYGTVSNSYATGSVSGGGSVGGLVGENYGKLRDVGTVSNCYATGFVTGTSFFVGGLVGNNSSYGTVSNCYAAGSVSGFLWDVGGLVGRNLHTVSNCYATGSVTGYKDVGGLVGSNYWSGTVSNCYATGSVTGGSPVGGLVGENDYARIFASFWDMQTTGQANGVGYNTGSGTVEVYGRTTAEMQTESTFTDYGWDFVGETANGTNDYWRMCIDNVNYPLLAWQFVPDFVCPDGMDFVDFAVLGLAWYSEPGDGNWNAICDISEPKDNVINELDLEVFVENWLSGK